MVLTLAKVWYPCDWSTVPDSKATSQPCAGPLHRGDANNPFQSVSQALQPPKVP